jgi:hypothetical protein
MEMKEVRRSVLSLLNVTELISKVQYRNSEKGQFHKIAMRNLEDTISLIKNYPWETERSLASIELTCPCVTIEHPSGSYLKVAPYFSGKFSLYYLDGNKIYLKTTDSIEDAVLWTKIYFEQEGKLQGFEKYSFTFKPIAYFKTNPFEYIIDAKAKLTFFKFPISIIPVILLIFLLKYMERPERFIALPAAVVMLLCLIAITPVVCFYLNYLLADKGSYLRIARGDDEFEYGTADNKKTYNKQNIAEINTYGVHYSRSLWSECEVFTINFSNGEQIKFTSLLISGSKLRMKFPDHKILSHKKFFPTVASVNWAL